MRKEVKTLTLKEYQEAIQYGCGVLINFENFTLLEGTDAEDNSRHIVVEALNGVLVNFSEPNDEVIIYELSLDDFHQLCVYYLLSLQPGMEHASNTLRKALRRLNEIAK